MQIKLPILTNFIINNKNLPVKINKMFKKSILFVEACLPVIRLQFSSIYITPLIYCVLLAPRDN